jgi:DNA gyrase subunit A
VLFFSDKGKVYSEKAYNVPEAARGAKGSLAHGFLALQPDEKITAVLPVTSFEDEGSYFIMATRYGRIKRVNLEEFAEVRPSGLIAISLDEGDVLEWVKCTDGEQDIVLGTRDGMSIRFRETDVRVMGRQAAGVSAIRLQGDDHVAGMDVIREGQTHVLVVTSNGYGKRTLLSEYNTQGRYGKGVRTIARNEKTGPVVALRCMKEDEDVLLMTRTGVVLRAGLDQVRETGRNTQGVRLIKIASSDKVVSITLISANGGAENGENGGEGDEENSLENSADVNGSLPTSANGDGTSLADYQN